MTLLAELEAQGKERGDTFRANQTRMQEIGDADQAAQEAIVDIRVKLQRLSDLQKREGELKSGRGRGARRRIAARCGARPAATPRSATLDGEAFAADLRAQIAALDAQRAALGYDSDRHSAARQSLETLPRI